MQPQSTSLALTDWNGVRQHIRAQKPMTSKLINSKVLVKNQFAFGSKSDWLGGVNTRNMDQLVAEKNREENPN